MTARANIHLDTMTTRTPFILASQSPRRAKLLRDAGVVFEQRDPPYADPDQPPAHLRGHEAEGYARALAERKAQSMRGVIRGPATVLAADTICVDHLGGLVGKPADRAHARAMLGVLMAGPHRVITGVALLSIDGAGDVSAQSFADSATVTFGPIGDDPLASYLDTGEWSGKAGGYNLFDREAAGWPIEVAGDRSTVVGLPMRRLMALINKSMS